MIKNLLFILIFGIITHLCALEVGQKAPSIILSGDNGGLVNGNKWSSSTIKDKVFIMFYVDPDEKDTNNLFSEMLKAKKFSKEKFQSIAIINMDATWLPNFAIESSLEEKQKQYPNTTYVKDMKKVLVDKWSLEDDSSVVVLFDKKGKVFYHTYGKIEKEESEKIIKLIEFNL